MFLYRSKCFREKCNEILQNRYLLLASILAMIGGVLFGYDLGVISGAMLQLQPLFQLSCLQQEIVISSMLVGALITSLTTGYFIDRFGRKVCIIISGVLYVTGAIVISVAMSYLVLLLGRLLLGCAISLAASSECVYVSEISTPHLRGSLLSMNEFGISLGFFLAYLSNLAFSGDVLNGWRWMFGISGFLAIIMILITYFLPRSPRFLLLKNSVEEAQLIWAKIRKLDVSVVSVHPEMKAMIEQAHTDTKLNCQVSKSVLYGFFIAISLVLLQQFCGQPNLLFYATTVLRSFGFKGSEIALMLSVGIGLVKLFSTGLCIAIVDKFERKNLLIVGCSIMALALLIITICILHYDTGVLESCSDKKLSFNHSEYSNISTTVIVSNGRILGDTDQGYVKWLVYLALVLFVGGYGISFGPLTWVIIGEIFPTRIRGRAYSYATSVNWGTNLLISLTFLDFSHATGSVGWLFLMNTVVVFFSLIFLYKFVPKTKCKTLEDIQEDLKKKGMKMFSKCAR